MFNNFSELKLFNQNQKGIKFNHLVLSEYTSVLNFPSQKVTYSYVDVTSFRMFCFY